MTRNISSTVLDRLDEGKVTLVGALFIDGELSIWGGMGNLTLTVPVNPTIYTGLQAPNLAAPVSFEIGASATGIEIVISGLDASIVPLVLTADLRGKSSILYWLFYDELATTQLDVEPMHIGSIDTIGIEDTPGGQAVVRIRIEGEAQGSSRKGGRIASDQDQRIIDSDDGAMRWVSSMAERTLHWGGSGPIRAGALKSGAAVSPGVGGK